MPRVRPQISMDDKFIEDPELEALLEERQEKKESASEANSAYREVDDKAQAQVLALDLPEEPPTRCGRFLLSKKTTDAQEVSFERAERTRASIRLVKVKE